MLEIVNFSMTYSVKIQFPMNNVLEVSGDSPIVLVDLINMISRKFFENSYVSKNDIILSFDDENSP